MPQGVDLAVADGVDRGQEAVGHLAIENWLEQTSRDKKGTLYRLSFSPENLAI